MGTQLYRQRMVCQYQHWRHQTFQFLSSEHLGYIDVERYSIIHDSRDIIWITTYGNGLFAYDLNTGDLQHFTFEVSHSSHINSNYLQYIIEDRSGGIWVSSEFSGLSHLEILNKGTLRIYPNGEDASDRSNTIRMLLRGKTVMYIWQTAWVPYMNMMPT